MLSDPTTIPWSLFFVLLCAYAVWAWVTCLKSAEAVTPKWKSRTTVGGLSLASVSTALSIFLFVHAVLTGGYPYYHPVEMFCITFGFLTALLGAVAAVVGAGKLGRHVAALSVVNLLLWIVDGIGQ